MNKRVAFFHDRRSAARPQWFVRDYVTARVFDPAVASLRAALLAPAANRPATVAHLLAGPGCGKTTLCSLLRSRMLSAGYGAGALCYYTDTKVLKDAFNRDTGFGPDEKNAPGKTVASFNWRT